MLVYFLFKFSFRDYIHEFLSSEDYYKIFEKKAKNEPLKVSMIVRFLYIPQIYKNFFLCLFDISFQDFYWPALLQYFPYLFLPLVIGSNLKSLTDFYHKGHIPNSTVYYSVLMFVSFFLLSLTLIGYLTWFAYSELSQIKKEMKKDLIQNHKATDNQTQVQKEDDNISRAESSRVFNMDN